MVMGAANRKPRAPRKAKVAKPTEAALLAAQAPAMPDRKTFLGGSDFAAVLGVSPWHTPVELWKLKTGRTEPAPVNPVRERQFARGKKLEPVVLDMVLDKLRERGHQVELIARNQRYIDPTYPFLSVEIDFELILDGELVNGDAKTVTGFARKKWGEEDSEDVPIEYAAQFMGGLMVCPGQRRRCLVAALIGLDDVAIYWVTRDDETIAGMRHKLVDFWINHVLADVPPDPLKFSDIKELFPLDNGRTVEASPEVAEKVEELRKLGIQIRMLDARRDELKLDIGQYIEPFAQLTKAGRLIATFKAHSECSLDTDALRRQHPHLYALFERTTSVRVLRLQQPRR